MNPEPVEQDKSQLVDNRVDNRIDNQIDTILDCYNISTLSYQTLRIRTHQAIKQLIDDEINAYIKPYLDYCEEQNGVRVCKNCGLTKREK